jgi:hypothetical protein
LDSAGFGAHGLPGAAAGLEDVVVGGPDAVGEEAFAEVEPEPLDGVELG